MNLYFDIGNTRLKCWIEFNETTEYFAYEHDKDFQLVLERLADEVVVKSNTAERVLVSNVAGNSVEELLIKFCGNQWGVVPEFARVERERLGLHNGYQHLSQLGIDRWVAMHGAFHFEKPYIVVDCGTAVTVDVVNNDNVFIGGAILPGVDLSGRSLSQTSGISDASFDKAIEKLGSTTEDCCLLGVMASCVGGIERVIAIAEQEISHPYTIIFTGGGSKLLMPILKFDYIYEPKLILMGLKRLFVCD